MRIITVILGCLLLLSAKPGGNDSYFKDNSKEYYLNKGSVKIDFHGLNECHQIEEEGAHTCQLRIFDVRSKEYDIKLYTLISCLCEEKKDKKGDNDA